MIKHSRLESKTPDSVLGLLYPLCYNLRFKRSPCALARQVVGFKRLDKANDIQRFS